MMAVIESASLKIHQRLRPVLVFTLHLHQREADGREDSRGVEDRQDRWGRWSNGWGEAKGRKIKGKQRRLKRRRIEKKEMERRTD